MENVPDFRKSVRSMTLPPIVEFLYWRMNWHTEHHMYAGVPCYNLKKLYHEIADDMPQPRTLVGAWREMREVWQRQKIDPDYVFDTPLPPTAQHVRTDTPDELEASIGELAPKGLQ
jgi:fatty acid desaturase